MRYDDDEKQIMDAWSGIERARGIKRDERSRCPTCGRNVVPIIQFGKKICPNCGRHFVYEHENRRRMYE